mmetsp:Transcript_60452/g.143690  ORF Transcript_60452/g.143690 Transcript_60452/m.143690 type:complete len:407 (-) Transcript_60452:1669-2889(-)
MFLLFESITGYAIFSSKEDLSFDIKSPNFQDKILNLYYFLKFFKLKYFAPFQSIEQVLNDTLCISNGVCSAFLLHFLSNTIKNKHKNLILGVCESKLAANINENLMIETISNELIQELMRIIRHHFEKISKDFFYRNINKAQCSVSHLFSQNKMKFNFERIDNMIIQSNFLIEQLDKNINFLSMICKEWYSWHFPELNKIVKDSYLYCLLIKFIGNKNKLTIKKLSELSILFLNEKIGKKIFENSKSSTGSNIEKIDMVIIENLSTCIVSLAEFKLQLNRYLKKKINKLAPNLCSVIGECLGAKLISKVGSLKNLSKYPSSTIQILGSEKALFRSLKKKTKTPKFGILFNSSFIRKTGIKNKAKIARFLSNKCSLACRIDFFSSFNTNLFGKKFKKQIKQRIRSFF